jgi:hypothetical protein
VGDVREAVGVSATLVESAAAAPATAAPDGMPSPEAPDTPMPAPDAPGADPRLERVRAGVCDGTIAPSIRGVQAAVRCGAPMVRRYLAQLEAEGLIRRTERGYERVAEPEAEAAEA